MLFKKHGPPSASRYHLACFARSLVSDSHPADTAQRGRLKCALLAFMPLIMALVAIPTPFLLTGGLTYLTPVNFIVEFLVALIGLGVSIDHSLLVVTRWREQRAKGEENETAVRNAMASAGRAVVFSGLTVAISLLALVVMPLSFLRNISSAGFLIPLVSVAVAVTLQFPPDAGANRVGHVPFAGPGLSQRRPGRKSGPVQHPFGVRRVRDNGAHLAVRVR